MRKKCDIFLCDKHLGIIWHELVGINHNNKFNIGHAIRLLLEYLTFS